MVGKNKISRRFHSAAGHCIANCDRPHFGVAVFFILYKKNIHAVRKKCISLASLVYSLPSIPVVFQAAGGLAALAYPSHLVVVDLKINKLLGINETHPAGSINAV